MCFAVAIGNTGRSPGCRLLSRTQMNTFQTQDVYNFVRDYKGGFILIDPLAGSEWKEIFGQERFEDLDARPLKHEYFEKNSPQAPCLLHIPISRIDLIEKLSKIAIEEATNPAIKTRSICGIIGSNLSVDEIHRELSSSLTIFVNFKRKYFRYFDPRVIHHLPELLPKDSNFLKKIEAWAYFDWNGSLRIKNFFGKKETNIPSGLHLTEGQWRQIDAITAFNATVSSLISSKLPCQTESTEKILASVNEALIAGLKEPNDVAAYVVFSTINKRSADQLPHWQDVLKLVESGASLAEILEDVNQ